MTDACFLVIVVSVVNRDDCDATNPRIVTVVFKLVDKMTRLKSVELMDTVIRGHPSQVRETEVDDSVQHISQDYIGTSDSYGFTVRIDDAGEGGGESGTFQVVPNRASNPKNHMESILTSSSYHLARLPSGASECVFPASTSSSRAAPPSPTSSSKAPAPPAASSSKAANNPPAASSTQAPPAASSAAPIGSSTQPPAAVSSTSAPIPSSIVTMKVVNGSTIPYTTLAVPTFG